MITASVPDVDVSVACSCSLKLDATRDHESRIEHKVSNGSSTVRYVEKGGAGTRRFAVLETLDVIPEFVNQVVVTKIVAGQQVVVTRTRQLYLILPGPVGAKAAKIIAGFTEQGYAHMAILVGYRCTSVAACNSSDDSRTNVVQFNVSATYRGCAGDIDNIARDVEITIPVRAVITTEQFHCVALGHVHRKDLVITVRQAGEVIIAELVRVGAVHGIVVVTN